MIPENTTPSQDEHIAAAASLDHIANLIQIIESLDLEVTRWKRAADEWDCSTSDELRDKIRSLPETY